MIKKITLLIINFFDYFHKMKITSFLKKELKKEIFIVDVGAHHGETISLFIKNFKVKKIISFEPSDQNFKILKNKIEKKFKNLMNFIVLEKLAIGSENKDIKIKKHFESSSSTIKEFNLQSKYLSIKNKFLDLDKDNFFEYENVKQTTLHDYFITKKINHIDLLKIDTEGYEYEVLKGLSSYSSKVKYILFEHHYDDMILKGYKFYDINHYLLKANFIMVFKCKMPFRKTFEYIYKLNK